jgi:serine/threonine protein phosphatase PrpC
MPKPISFKIDFDTHDLKIAGISDRGSVRNENQDYFIILDNQSNNLPDWCGAVVAVFDGASGMENGSIASTRAAMHFLRAIQLHAYPVDDLNSLTETLRLIVQETHTLLKKDSFLFGFDLGTTIAALIYNNIDMEQAHLITVGDSSIYLSTVESVKKLSKEDSFVDHLVAKEFISEDQAVNHPWSRVMTQVLGMQNEIDPNIKRVQVRRGDRIIIMTDGITETLSIADIENIISSSTDINMMCDVFIKKAKLQYATDNITLTISELV